MGWSTIIAGKNRLNSRQPGFREGAGLPVKNGDVSSYSLTNFNVWLPPSA
jgi:hypothetical protein